MSNDASAKSSLPNTGVPEQIFAAVIGSDDNVYCCSVALDRLRLTRQSLPLKHHHDPAQIRAEGPFPSDIISNFSRENAQRRGVFVPARCIEQTCKYIKVEAREREWTVRVDFSFRLKKAS